MAKQWRSNGDYFEQWCDSPQRKRYSSAYSTLVLLRGDDESEHMKVDFLYKVTVMGMEVLGFVNGLGHEFVYIL
jgi:hypothetical protein